MNLTKGTDVPLLEVKCPEFLEKFSKATSEER